MVIRTAIFPVGGLGTRFLPATKAVPKEMLPVVDKPLIQYAVEEARDAGIENFVFVTAHGKEAVENHFDRNAALERALRERGDEELLELARVFDTAPGRIAYVRQMDALGLGHAVWCARNLIGDEPFAVLLADELLRGDRPPLVELIELHERVGGNVISVMEVPPDETGSYGIVAPGLVDGRTVEVEGLVEKPDPADAPSNYAAIGRYVLEPEVMRVLDEGRRGAGGEIQLTDALARMIGEAPFHAVIHDGARYDCGSKAGFIEATVALALEREDLRPAVIETLRRILPRPVASAGIRDEEPSDGHRDMRQFNQSHEMEYDMTKIKELAAAGQSVWLDFIRRDMVHNGELAALVDEGITGVTSNPSIFEKAIAGSSLYDGAIGEAAGEDSLAVFESLAVEDVRDAADVLRGVYDATDGRDGFVSLEVSPTLAADTEGTIADALRLWGWVDRPNLMIKVPATPEGVVAVEELIAAGVNVNATLMFSLDDYEAVAMAYVRGVERAGNPERVASVASFFVSRVDGKVDSALEAIGTEEALALRGKAAVANAKLAYRRYQEIFEGDVFADARSAGARPQRALWASTSTKNPAYPDTLYVAELIGPNTVNTVPPATIDAFRDHGVVDPTALTTGVDAARTLFSDLDRLGIDFGAITDELQTEGVASFEKAFDQLLAAIVAKRNRS